MLGPLLIRADANSKVGSGHVMRCLALAQEWRRRGGDAMFYGDIDAANGKRILKEKFGLCTGNYRPSGLDGFAWVVTDNYQIEERYQRLIKDHSKSKLLVIDDYGHLSKYHADIILNQNIDAEDIPYTVASKDTRLLLGTKYAMLRNEFLRISAPTRKRISPPVAKSLLITMGGADPDNVTTKIIKALNLVDIEDLIITVVVGGSNRHYEEIFKAIGSSRHSHHIHLDVEDMQNHIIWSDFAISGGGRTCWELAYLGTPMALVTLAENQVGNIVGLKEVGAAYALRWDSLEDAAQQISQLILDQEWRAEMQANAQTLVDDLGAGRVVTAMIGAKE